MKMHFEFKPAWEEVNSCLLCDGQETLIFDQRTEHGFDMTNRICLDCGLVYQTPRMDRNTMTKYYQKIYDVPCQGVQGVTRKTVEIQKRRAEHLVERLAQHASSFSCHLDIGSSTGMLLAQVRERFKSQAVGVEISETYREYSQNLGLEVHPTLGDFPKTYKRRFNLISLAHVLEHLIEPRETLILLREQWLTENGLLLVEVPNLFFHATFELPHLTHYHTGTLTAMVGQSGYQMTQLVKHGAPRSRRFLLNLIAFARPAAARHALSIAKQSPALIRGKRRMGRFAYLAVANAFKLLRLGRPSELESVECAMN